MTVTRHVSATVPDAGPGSIRPLAREDIPELVALRRQAFKRSERGGPDDLAAYFERIFFQSPFRDPGIHSLVYEDERGRVGGFVGAVPRRMLFRGEPIRVVIETQMMVALRCGGGVGRRLLSQLLAGPQDLTLTDDANNASRRLWESLGGERSAIHGLRWVRPLRPIGHTARRFTRSALGRGVVTAARPLIAAADALVARLPGPSRQAPPPGSIEPLDARGIVTHLEEVAGSRSLRPAYDEASLQWLLAQLVEKERLGTPRQALVRDQAGDVAGWFVYYVNPGATSEVLQVAARPAAEKVVLRCLFWDAWRHGACAVAGRVEPWLVEALGGTNWAILRWVHQWTLVHSRRLEILHAIEQGDALLSLLDGEWWLGF